MVVFHKLCRIAQYSRAPKTESVIAVRQAQSMAEFYTEIAELLCPNSLFWMGHKGGQKANNTINILFSEKTKMASTHFAHGRQKSTEQAAYCEANSKWLKPRIQRKRIALNNKT